jgi:hypothetical protein
MMRENGMLVLLLCGALIWSCGGQEKKSESQASAKQEGQGPPVGTWYLYAGSDSGNRTEVMDEEVTILVLDDSTYTLTLMQPTKQLNFVEQGSVSFNERSKSMDFVVFSATGVDFSGDEPRKLVDVEQIVAWERAPGTAYQMIWRSEWQREEGTDVDREVLVLKMSDHEDSFFVRLQNTDASSSDLDARLQPQNN